MKARGEKDSTTFPRRNFKYRTAAVKNLALMPARQFA